MLDRHGRNSPCFSVRLEEEAESNFSIDAVAALVASVEPAALSSLIAAPPGLARALGAVSQRLARAGHASLVARAAASCESLFVIVEEVVVVVVVVETVVVVEEEVVVVVVLGVVVVVVFALGAALRLTRGARFACRTRSSLL